MEITENQKKTIINTISIPSYTNMDDLGIPLFAELDNNSNIKQVNVTIKGINLNFIDLIKEKTKYIRKNHTDQITTFDQSCKFYYIKSKIDYILVVKTLNDNIVEKYKYSTSGILISKIKDVKSENKLIRTNGSRTLIIENNNVIETSSLIKLKPLSKVKIKKDVWLPDSNIGVIDTETYLNNNSIQEIYALGFKTKLDASPVTYYIDNSNGKTNNSREIVLTMINELLRPKYNNITFYCHNLGGYDVIYFLKVLNDYNQDSNNIEKYKISQILRDDKIIRLTIRKDKNVLTIVDSYCILTNSLSALSKHFDVETSKSLFPYKFSVENNLFYIGQTPGIKYYNDISQLEYNKLYSDNWSFKEETIKYLNNDLNCLYEVINKANKQIFKDYKINMTESITISGLAMKIYLNKYYKDNIPLIDKPSIYKDIKQAYYGGITEVYRPYGENLFYYDVNCLYPYASLNDMPGLDCEKINYIHTNNNPDIFNLFGFFYCKIETPKDLYFGLLPIRNKLGIELPVGSWYGWYYSEELKFAKENGYLIKVLNGYSFNRVTNVFKDYISDVYAIKSNPENTSQKTIAKSLLNNLLGRFGISFDKAITEIMNTSLFNEKSLMNKIISYKEIGDDKLLVTYLPKLDYDIVNSHNLDFIKVLSKHKDKELSSIDNTSIVISAAVTAYARIYINKIKLYILSHSKNIYYSDTDSIVTDMKLGDHMVDNKEIGKLKLEHKINKGIFITNKTYCLLDKDNNFINKAKGVKSNSLNLSDYEKLLNNNNITTAVKSYSKTDWTKGEVKILEKSNITINSNSYQKRDKIYSNNKWINTKPKVINSRGYHTKCFNQIYINYFDTSLVVYKAPKLAIVLIPEITKNNYIPFYLNVHNKFKTILCYILLVTSLVGYGVSFLCNVDDDLSINDDIEENGEEIVILETKAPINIESKEPDYNELHLDLNKDVNKDINNELDLDNKYIGIEDIRYLFDIEINNEVKDGKDGKVSSRPTTADSNNTSISNSLSTDTNPTTISSGPPVSELINDNTIPFSPFTPNTLENLMAEIKGTRANI